MTDGHRPLHLVILGALSTAGYAVALAAVTTLQSGADQALIADRAPTVAAAEQAAAAHRAMSTLVDDTARRYRLLADGYDRLAGSIGGYETALDEQATRADSITESLHSLPTRIQLPSVPTMPAAAPRTTTRPATHATTGASG